MAGDYPYFMDPKLNPTITMDSRGVPCGWDFAALKLVDDVQSPSTSTQLAHSLNRILHGTASDFVLPGAEMFSRYLGERADGRLSLNPLEVPTNVYGEKEWTHIWAIKCGSDVLGRYSAKMLTASSLHYKRCYSGIVPGYINAYTIRMKEMLPSVYGDTPLEQVYLEYSDEEQRDIYNGHDTVTINTGVWMRKDNCPDIPFP